MAAPGPTPSDKKAKVKLELREKDVAQKIAFGKAVTTAMLAAPEFSGITAAINTAKDIVSALDTSKTQKDLAEEAAQAATANQDHKTNAFDIAFTELGNLVDNIAKGDKEIIDKAAMGHYYPGKSGPVGNMPQVKNLNLSAGDMEGELDAHWDSIKGAKSYNLQWSSDTPDNWKPYSTVTKSNASLSGFGSGIKIWVRVAAIGAAGQGPWSDPAFRFTP